MIMWAQNEEPQLSCPLFAFGQQTGEEQNLKWTDWNASLEANFALGANFVSD